MIKKIQYLIFPALILLVALSVYLLDKDINKYSEIIAEQETRIENVEKQLGYHNIRLNGQMDTLMVHRSRLEQIKTFLENMSQSYVLKK
jgi:archaellum component FlaC